MDVNRSKKLSFILRHHPEKFNCSIDKQGWVLVDELINGSDFTLEELQDIVGNDTRYEFNSDNTKVRAFHGHSIEGVEPFKEFKPMGDLYHGSAVTNIDSINEKGIHKMTRNFVHLSKDLDKAKLIGQRHGSPCVFIIDALTMSNDNIKFYDSEDDVILVDYVHPKYIKEVVCK